MTSDRKKSCMISVAEEARSAGVSVRLKEARTNCGVSQETASQALGVPRTAIVHIEAGNRSISTVELVLLAKLYSRPIAEFFREPEMAQEDNALLAINRVAPEYRDDAQVKEAITRCIAICHEGVTLEGMLGMKPRIGPPAYSLPSPRTTIDAVRQGQFAADEERKRLALGDNPVLDMSDLLCSQGIWATGASLPGEMSGLFLLCHHIIHLYTLTARCPFISGR